VVSKKLRAFTYQGKANFGAGYFARKTTETLLTIRFVELNSLCSEVYLVTVLREVGPL